MFGKDYDKDIENLNKRINDIIDMQNKNQKVLLKINKDTQELINGFESSLMELAKVQQSHKDAIMLLSKR